MVTRRGETRGRILASATNLFGTRGLDAVSLDLIASEVGVAKQTVLYWFPSKDDLVQEVLSAVAAELAVVVEAAIRAASSEPLDRLEAVVKAVFSAGVRKPELLGLVREISRLPIGSADRLTEHLQPMVSRAVTWMGHEMDSGRLRRADPAMIVALVYATVTGIATEPEALRVVGWSPDVVGLRRLRTHLVEFVRSALEP